VIFQIRKRTLKLSCRFLTVLIGYFLANNAFGAIYDAKGVRLSDYDANSDKVHWTAVSFKSPQHISAVGVLKTPYFGDICTATFMDSGHDEGPAYFISAAHCNFFSNWNKDDLSAQHPQLGLPTKFYIALNRFFDAKSEDQIQVPLTCIAFISEHHTDLSLFQSELTQGELRKKGITPLKLALQKPEVGDSLELIGIPLMYVVPWNRVLYSSQCQALYITPLLNGEDTLPESYAHKCASLPGFSGGPLINTKTHEISMINTHGSDQLSSLWAKDCQYAARACEILPNGQRQVNDDVSYGQAVAPLSHCFNAKGIFDLSLKSCQVRKLQ
jgi:hypothetical protein